LQVVYAFFVLIICTVADLGGGSRGLNKEDLELMLKINGDFTLSNND
jgi:hypothetical protein